MLGGLTHPSSWGQKLLHPFEPYSMYVLIWLFICILYNQLVNVSNVSLNCSSKLITPEERVMGTLVHSWLFRNTGNNLHLRMMSEWGQSWRAEPLLNLWDLMLWHQVDSVRVELNCRTLGRRYVGTLFSVVLVLRRSKTETLSLGLGVGLSQWFSPSLIGIGIFLFSFPSCRGTEGDRICLPTAPHL